jgi:hypothetical protein
MSSINGSKKTSMSMLGCCSPDMRVVNRRYFRVYAHNNWSGIVWVPHLSKMVHSISVKTKPNISWIIREVLLMVKVEIFPLPTISRMSDLSIHLSMDMPKQELNIPRIGEHMLQVVNDR